MKGKRLKIEDFVNPVFRVIRERSNSERTSSRREWEVVCLLCKKETIMATCRIKEAASCGCRGNTMGISRHSHPLYNIFTKMIDRCENPLSKHYKWYGARGIIICPAWRASFERFCADMGPRPSAKHSIDRINNEGNYEPGNCRWATPVEQCRNRRSTRTVEFNGEKRLLIELCAEFNMPSRLVRTRIDRDNMDVTKALLAPRNG